MLYNTLRDLKLDAWKAEHVSLNENDLRRIALEKRRQNKGLQGIHSQVVRGVATRVARALENYFKGRARFPKRETTRSYRSLTYPQASGYAEESLRGAAEPS